jgi:hypothetical protein
LDKGQALCGGGRERAPHFPGEKPADHKRGQCVETLGEAQCRVTAFLRYQRLGGDDAEEGQPLPGQPLDPKEQQEAYWF